MDVITPQSALVSCKSVAGDTDNQVTVTLNQGEGVHFYVTDNPMEDPIAVVEVMVDHDGEFRVMVHSDGAEGSECVYSYQGEQ